MADTLLVDSGNILYKLGKNRRVNDEDRLRADAISHIYTKLGYHAMAIGPGDLQGGMKALLEQTAQGVPWVSANIVDKTGEPLFPPWKIVQTKLGQVGIIGLTGQYVREDSEVTIKPWAEVLAEQVAYLHENCVLLILLANVDDDEINTIAARFPEINIAISANPKSGNVKPRKVNATLLTQTHTQGKYLGKVNLSWGDDILTTGDHLDISKARVRSRFRALTENVAVNPDVEQLLRQMIKSDD